MLGAYRRGIIPMPAPDEYFRTLNEVRYEDQVADGTIAVVGGGGDPYWVGVVVARPAPGDRHWRRPPGPERGRRRLRRDDLATTADAAFGRVAEACRAGREPRWLTDPLLGHPDRAARRGLGAQHRGVAGRRPDRRRASGIGIGGVISGDSLFGRQPGAAAIAVADMAARLEAAGGLLIDAQWDSPFLRSLGAELLPRERYRPFLTCSAERIVLPGEPRPARRLLAADLWCI